MKPMLPKLERMYEGQRHIYEACALLSQNDDTRAVLGYLGEAREALMHKIETFIRYDAEPSGWESLQKWAEDHGKIISITEVEESPASEK